MDRGADAWVANMKPPFEQGLRAEGADQRDVHQGGDDPPDTEAAGEERVNLTKQALRGGVLYFIEQLLPHITVSPPLTARLGGGVGSSGMLYLELPLFSRHWFISGSDTNAPSAEDTFESSTRVGISTLC